jgi:hypothetical protein
MVRDSVPGSMLTSPVLGRPRVYVCFVNEDPAESQEFPVPNDCLRANNNTFFSWLYDTKSATVEDVWSEWEYKFRHQDTWFRVSVLQDDDAQRQGRAVFNRAMALALLHYQQQPKDKRRPIPLKMRRLRMVSILLMNIYLASEQILLTIVSLDGG